MFALLVWILSVFFPSICFKAFAGVFLSHFPLFMKFILSCALMADTKGVLYLFAAMLAWI